ncbi:hypothetical protein HW49_01160 [Porphyromonadaceae bacterium COT-184 OH4590]|nr:hypothetical protein HW49_01160 [Porphyromonadaceae bacterium COT-184 OH4590]
MNEKSTIFVPVKVSKDEVNKIINTKAENIFISYQTAANIFTADVCSGILPTFVYLYLLTLLNKIKLFCLQLQHTIIQIVDLLFSTTKTEDVRSNIS